MAACCGACEQSHDHRARKDDVPRDLSSGRPAVKLCVELGICPACSRLLVDITDRVAFVDRLRLLGFDVGSPFVIRVPPGSAGLPFDWY